ncbi:MAG TPA: NAD-dependent epimerase/dehydratase family protein [Phycisphaerae bacterium]|nr:NAD-dependent epimerase/dehydratase family protein [Phycisphaerae bacterium]
MPAGFQVVTGAFGYSGQYMARRLLSAGVRVRTLTNSPERHNRFGDLVEAHPYNFDAPEKLAESLRGATVLYNTYWVRFNHKGFTFAQAVKNSETLFAAAKAAGVKRIVHVSITNPDEKSKLEYFRGKAIVEKMLVETGTSHAILRPAVLFGKEDILVNNIAWILRRFPFFGVFGKGDYKLQPIYVDDFAAVAVDAGKRTENAVIDAIGPETFTYRGLVETVAGAIGVEKPIKSMRPMTGRMLGWLVGKLVKDVVITKDEIRGLMENKLFVDGPCPRQAQTRLSEWAKANREWLGNDYASELSRREDRVRGYVESREPDEE